MLEEVKSWQSRALDKAYPIVYFDALVVKIRQDKQIVNKSIYLALGINSNGEKELLGMWCHSTEGAKFWLNVLTELTNRSSVSSGKDSALYCTFNAPIVTLCQLERS